MPREEVERYVPCAHVVKEVIAVRGAVIWLGECRTAHERRGIRPFHRAGEKRVELEELLRRTAPEQLAEIRLVPDFPVADAVVKAPVPAAVVVPNDVLDDGGVALEARRGRDFGGLTAPETKQHL